MTKKEIQAKLSEAEKHAKSWVASTEGKQAIAATHCTVEKVTSNLKKDRHVKMETLLTPVTI